MKTALSLGSKCNYMMLGLTERGIDLPKVVHKKHQTGEGGVTLVFD